MRRILPRTSTTRFPRRRTIQSLRSRVSRTARRSLRLESLECRRLLDGDPLIAAAHGGPDDMDDPGQHIHGTKWNDLNANGRHDPGEPGLAGVTVYSDLNNNGRLDDDEPSAVTMEDDPNTRFDETGMYWLEGLMPGSHVIREVVPTGFVQTFPGRHARVTSSETGRFQEGIALDYDVTGVEIVPSPASDGTTIDLELTVVWPDSCGSLVADMATHTVVGDHILVQMYGEQVGNVCAEVISPESQTIRIAGLDQSRYRVVGVLNEDLGKGDFVPTLAVVGGVEFAARGSHSVTLEPGDVVDGIDFGNHLRRPGSAHGLKWMDRNGNGQRDPNEPGLPGVTIYSDLNFNGVLDEGEPRTVTMDDDPSTFQDETGHYWLEDLVPGLHVIREVVPDGFIQTFPPRFRFDVGAVEPLLLPFPGDAHVIHVEPGQAVENLDFGNRRIEPGSVHGTKWADRNGNGQRDNNEPGLAGVLIFSDLNGNTRLDDDEPRTRTMEDDPDTAVDETGLYWLRLDAGRHIIREIVPDGFRQTFPPTGPIPLPIDEIGFAPDIFPIVGGAHVVFVEPGGTIEGLDFGNQPLPGSVHGRKWNDLDGDGRQDPNEPGLSGVTIYVDRNNNGRLDDGEQHTVTMKDDPVTNVDESGLYWLDGLPPGRHVIREVVPDGFVQTFPPHIAVLPEDGHQGDELSSVDPDQIVVTLAAGEVFETQVSWAFHPLCVRPFEVDVVATDPDVSFENLTGVLLNGCGGDVSTFDVRMVGDGLSHFFELQFVDAAFGGVLDVILVTILGPNDGGGGAHIVRIEPGGVVEGRDFGNHPQSGSVHGRKWNDLDRDGEQDPDEPGLPGVTIYVDRNNNGQLDPGERRMVTMEDDPVTDFDEAGLYWLDGLPPGRHVIREVVPDGFVQTFPPRVAVLPGDGHEPDEGPSSVDPDQIVVTLAAGEVFETQVSWSFEPFCVRPFEVDVVASDPDVSFENLTGVLINSCGGDVSTFDVRMIGDGLNHLFELQFVDAEFGGVLDTIPVVIRAPSDGGAHIVRIEPGGTVEGRDFGNHRVDELGSIHGLKWNDLDGDGRRDANEPGLPGVTIYVDRNNNGRLDDNERRTETMEDDPNTLVDESGRYWLSDLPPGEHVIREIVPDGFVQTFPDRGATVTSSETGRFQQGIALDFDLTGVEIVPSTSADRTTIDLELTVVWPDSCGSIVEGMTTHTVIDNHILVQMYGEQVGTICADVISPQSQSIRISGLDENRYRVVGVLNEDLGSGEFVPTLAVVGGIAFAADGGRHVVRLLPGETVEGIDFGNRSRAPGSAHGVKWVDRNGNAERDPNEPGLPGVTIYSDLNFNGVLDEGEPRTVTMEDDPNTAVDEAGHYWLENLTPGLHVVREVVPDGFVQTFPRRFPFDIGTDEPLTLPFPGGAHVIRVQPGQAVENLDFGNRRIEPGTVHGTKWIDLNGNGQRERNEPGLPGVVIYSDLNGNRRLDDDEPSARTIEDDPDTAVDEAGLYWLRLEPGRHVIREVVPDGFVQTFPPAGPIPLPFGEVGFAPDIFPIVGGAHVVFVEPGDTIEGLDFGNRRLPLGDFNGDGLLNCRDLRILNEEIVSGNHSSSFDLNADGLVDFGDTKFWISNIYGTISGDANLDFRVNAQDLNILGLNWRESGKHLSWCDADFDGDHMIGASDLNEIGLNWQRSAAPLAARPPRAPLQASATRAPITVTETLHFASAAQSSRTVSWRGDVVETDVESESRWHKRTRRVDDYFARRNSNRLSQQTSSDRFEGLADDVFAGLASFTVRR